MVDNLFIIIIFLFGIVHFIEVLAFFARQAGFVEDNTALGYALQNSVFMLTRIFTMALFPLLGLIVDSGVEYKSYLLMTAISLVTASAMGIVVTMLRKFVVGAFVLVIDQYKSKGKMFYALLRFPLYFYSVIQSGTHKGEIGKFSLRSSFFFGGALVFGIYSISVFLSFYFGLVFYDYRATITQLSGLSNAIATVVLTFFIEPKLSSLIDRDKKSAVDSLTTLMVGRSVGTLICGILFFCASFIVW